MFDGWNDADAAQLVKLVQVWGTLTTGAPIDRRVFTSRRVRQWGLLYNLLREDGGRLVVNSSCPTSFTTDLPIAALWLLLGPAIPTTGSIGGSLARHPVWDTLNCYCDPARRLQEQERALIRLASAGLIWFQSAGHAWHIERQQHVA